MNQIFFLVLKLNYLLLSRVSSVLLVIAMILKVFLLTSPYDPVLVILDDHTRY